MFNSKTGTQAKKIRDLQSLKDENEKLRRENERLTLEVSRLQQRVEELENSGSKKSTKESTEIDVNSILLKYLEITKDNMTKLPQGRRYEGLHEFFALMSLMGPHYFDMLTSNMLFPTYKTATKYLKHFLNIFQIDDDTFNGSVDNIVAIMQKYLPQDFVGKGVIMVDAAYVTPYVRISKDGKVEGILNITQIDPSIAECLINNDDAFLDFIKINYDSVIQAEFGMTFAPLNPRYKPFPIACISSTSGKATKELVAIIESIISQLPKNVNIIGIGSDGDNTYDGYSNTFIDNIINDFEKFLDLGAVEIIETYAIIIHFSDPFHLTKNDRYRKSSRDEFLVTPNDAYETRSFRDLLDLGIPQYLLDNNKGRKMEDELPLKLFNLQTIQKIIDNGDFHLLISMLPSTLLLESLHRDSLNRQDTVDYLLFGASIVLVFYIMQKQVIDNQFEIYRIQPQTYKKKRCFTDKWCKHYIFTAIGIASQIIAEEEIDTGACSSHYQEHSFANVRRHCKGDNSHMKFIRSMKYILLEHIMIDEMQIKVNIPKSRSDSGKTIKDATPIEIRPIRYYLQHAKRLWRNVTNFRRFKLLSSINEYRKKMEIDELIEILGTFSEKNRSSISTKSTGMIKTAGLNNMIFWNAETQLNDLVDDDDDE